MIKLSKIVCIIALVFGLVSVGGMYDGTARFQVNTFMTRSEVFTPIINAIKNGQRVVITMHDNPGGVVVLQQKLQQAISRAKAPVYVISSGYIVSAAFDMAFNGSPSRIFYDATLAQHSVSDGDGNPIEWATRWTIEYSTPGLFTPEEIEQLVRKGTTLSIRWTGKYACERAAKAGYNVKFYRTYCDFNRFKP